MEINFECNFAHEFRKLRDISLDVNRRLFVCKSISVTASSPLIQFKCKVPRSIKYMKGKVYR